MLNKTMPDLEQEKLDQTILDVNSIKRILESSITSNSLGVLSLLVSPISSMSRYLIKILSVILQKSISPDNARKTLAGSSVSLAKSILKPKSA